MAPQFSPEVRTVDVIFDLGLFSWFILVDCALQSNNPHSHLDSDLVLKAHLNPLRGVFVILRTSVCPPLVMEDHDMVSSLIRVELSIFALEGLISVPA